MRGNTVVMPRFRLRHVPLVLRALARWLVGTQAGRKLGAVVAILVAAPVALMWSLGGGAAISWNGTWTGFSNDFAPTEGRLTFHRGAGKTASCTVRGETGATEGNGWVFRGKATVNELSCEGHIEKNGRASLALKLKMEWHGRVKGIGGDWDDIDGAATCEGELGGTLAEGGEWEGTCKREGKEWKTSFKWKLDAE